MGRRPGPSIAITGIDPLDISDTVCDPNEVEALPPAETCEGATICSTWSQAISVRKTITRSWWRIASERLRPISTAASACLPRKKPATGLILSEMIILKCDFTPV